MKDQVREVTLVVNELPDVDQVELEVLTVNLLKTVSEIDVAGVQRPSGGLAPSGAKPGDIATLGVLLVTTAPILIRPLVQLLETWVKNRPVRSIKVQIGDDTIEVSRLSERGQRALIEAFIMKHSGENCSNEQS
ncbi:hypothetical protein AB0J43_00615 [Nonomuraea fuscirosea]